jgi:hypothetical protein
MGNCEQLPTCAFYNEKLKDLPGLSEGLKRLYCWNETPNCARFMVLKAIGREKIPLDLFPNELERAKTIISQEQPL